MRKLVQQVNDARITIHTIDGGAKRPALVRGIQQVKSPVVALVDDHIIWSPDTLHGLLDVLSESCDVGGVTPIKNNKNPETTALEAIAATRLDRRSMANAAMAYFANGQVIVCSGKTSVYRTEILQDPDFLEYFTRHMWMNKYPLVSRDDVAITYWLYQNGWRMGFVSQDEYAVIAQQVLGTFRIHLGQVLLWARDRIRLILRDIGTIVSGSSPSRYCLLSLRSIVFPVMTEDYLLIPDFLTVLLVLVARGAGFVSPTAVILSTWIVLLQYLRFNALLELTGNLSHFSRCPQSLWQLPVLAFWAHVRMVMTIYAFLTPNQVSYIIPFCDIGYITDIPSSGWMTRIGAA